MIRLGLAWVVDHPWRTLAWTLLTLAVGDALLTLVGWGR